MGTIVLDNFQGGLLNSTALQCAQNEATELVGLDHRGQGLRVMAGPDALPLSNKWLHSDGCTTGTTTSLPFKNIEPYTDASGRSYLIGKRGHTVWVGTPDSADMTTNSASTGNLPWDEAADVIAPLNESGTLLSNIGISPVNLTSFGAEPYKWWSRYVRSFNKTDFILTSYTPFQSETWQVSVMVRWDGDTTIEGCIFNTRDASGSNVGGIYMSRTSAGKLYLKVADNSGNSYTLTSTATLSANAWHHVMVTQETDSVPVFYIDGIMAGGTGAGNPSGFTTTTANTLKIGGVATGTTTCSGGWQGQIADFMFEDDANWTQGYASTMYSTLIQAYSESPQDINYNWYPLLGDVYYDAATRYLSKRVRPSEPETVVQIGNYVYFSPDEPMESDYTMRWDGTLIHCGWCYTDGTLKCNYALSNAGVRSGDIIYFANWDVTAGAWRWKELDGRVISTVSNSNPAVITLTYTYTTTGLGSPGYANIIPYCIVRVHRLGIPTSVPTTGAVHTTSLYGGLGYNVGDVLTLVGGGSNCTVTVAFLATGGQPVMAGSTPTAAGTGYLANTLYTTTVAPAGGTGAKAYVYAIDDVCTTSLNTAASSFTNSTVRHKWRYKNNHTGYSGSASSASSPLSVTSAKTVSVSGWGTTPPADALDVNEVEIFRSVNSGPYYYAGSVYGDINTNFPSSFTDTNAATGNVLDDYADYHTRPGALRNLTAYNNRLIAGGSPIEPHWMYQSTMDSYEYWPTIQWDASDPQAVLQLLGFRYMVGDSAGEPVTALVPAVGADRTNAQTAANLLIMMPNRSVWWTGYVWADFAASHAFSKGTINRRTVMHTQNSLVFIGGDREHIYELPLGGIPVPIEKRLWPAGLGNVVSTRDILKDWRLAEWNGWYLFLGRLSGTTNTTIWMYDPNTGTWTSELGVYNDLLIPNDQTLHGVFAANATVGTYSGLSMADVSGLFEDTITARSITYATGSAVIADKPRDIFNGVRIDRVTGCITANNIATQKFQLDLYRNGDRTTSRWNGEESVILAGGTASYRGFARWFPSQSLPQPLISMKLSSTNAKPNTEVNVISVDFTVEGDATGL